LAAAVTKRHVVDIILHEITKSERRQHSDRREEYQHYTEPPVAGSTRTPATALDADWLPAVWRHPGVLLAPVVSQQRDQRQLSDMSASLSFIHSFTQR